MSNQERPFVVALHFSDAHFWDTPSPFREKEQDWFAAMQRPIEQIKALKRKYKCPIVFAGDLFDRWKATPETICWALRHLPEMYAIPGQHDLPNHRYSDMNKSAYGALVEAGRLVDLKPGIPHPLDNIVLWGFPWGFPVSPPSRDYLDTMNVAVVHDYLWRRGKSFPNAPKDKHIDAWIPRLKGYTVALFGDQHKRIFYEADGLTIANTGTLMIRRSDEKDHVPSVSLVWSDGYVSEEKLDTSADVYSEIANKETVVENNEIDTAELIESLGKLKQTRIDFVACVNQLLTSLRVSQDVREKIHEALEGK